MKHLIIFITFTFFPHLSFTQEATLNLEWTQTEYLNSVSTCPKVLVDKMGNTFVCADTYAPGPAKGFITLKYDSLGNFLWRKTFDPSTIDVLKDAELLSDGSIVVAGVQEYPEFDGRLKIFRYDAAGDTIWSVTHKIEPGLHTSMEDLMVDSEDNTYVVGRNANENTGIGHLTLTKIDSNGQIVWDNWYNEQGNNFYVGVVGRLLEDKIIIAGKRGGNYIIHQVTYGGETIASVQKPFSDIIMKNMWLDSEGATYIGNETGEYKITKIDLNGDTLWTYNKPRVMDFPNIAEGSLTNVAFDADNNIYIAGHYYTEDTRSDCLITKLESNGNVLWERFFKLTDLFLSDFPNAIAVDENYVYLAVQGVEVPDSITNYNYALVVYTLDGEEIAHISYDHKETDWIKSIFVKDDCIYITGNTYNDSPDPIHALTQKYRLDIPSVLSKIEEQAALFSVHPNPAKDVLHLDIELDDISSTKGLEVQLYDAVGNLVKRKAVLETGMYLDIKDLTEGVYFVKMQVGQRSLGVKKVVILK